MAALNWAFSKRVERLTLLPKGLCVDLMTSMTVFATDPGSQGLSDIFRMHAGRNGIDFVFSTFVAFS